MPNTRKSCHLCGRPFSRTSGAPRVACTMVGRESAAAGRRAYAFSSFHAACLARSPGRGVAIMTGAMRRKRV